MRLWIVISSDASITCGSLDSQMQLIWDVVCPLTPLYAIGADQIGCMNGGIGSRDRRGIARIIDQTAISR